MYNAAFFKEVVNFYAEDQNRNIKPKSCPFDGKFLVQKAQITLKSRNIILNEESYIG